MDLQRTPNGDWIEPALVLPSPNHDARPAGIAVDLVVVHGISLPAGSFGTPHVAALFMNCLDACAHADFATLAGLRVSTHLLVDRGGSLTQFVALDRRAWHAGVSSWEGRDRCNDFSIGIELEGCDDIAYSDAQYATLAALVVLLRANYPAISAARVVGHSDIAPGRKTDPGAAFDWPRLRAMAREIGTN